MGPNRRQIVFGEISEMPRSFSPLSTALPRHPYLGRFSDEVDGSSKFSFDKQRVHTGHWRQREQPASKPLAMELCKHPRVRVLTREEDAEFVECLECGEVFDSHEFTDMAIEEKSMKSAEERDE